MGMILVRWIYVVSLKTELFLLYRLTDARA